MYNPVGFTCQRTYRITSLFTLLLFLSVDATSYSWGIYSKLLMEKPLLTKSITSCATNAFSDVLCQNLIITTKEEEGDTSTSKSLSIDKRRLGQAAVTGLIWSGPITHYWYKILFGKLTISINDPIIGLVVQILLDSIIFSPITVSGYFTLRSIMEGSGIEGIKDKLSTRLVKTVLGAWKFWPAANIVNFGFIPLEFRVLYMNIMSIFWSFYLTYVNGQKITSKKV